MRASRRSPEPHGVQAAFGEEVAAEAEHVRPPLEAGARVRGADGRFWPQGECVPGFGFGHGEGFGARGVPVARGYAEPS